MGITVFKRKFHWDNILLVSLQIIAVAVFGLLRIGTFTGAITATIFGVVVFFGVALLGTGLKKLDKYEVRDKLPLLLKDFLRKNPDIRGWFANLVIIPLVITLWFNLIIG